MSSDYQEVLVLLADPLDTPTINELEEKFHVLQIASRRLVLVRLDESQLEELRSVKGVKSIFEGEVPEEDMVGMEQIEELFARGWSLQREEFPKDRPGNGLVWDSEGFEPPDTPNE